MFGQLCRRVGHGTVGAVAAADVAYLSAAMFSHGMSDARDAADLIAFDQLVVADAPEWAAFFIDAIASHLLRDVAPADAMTREKAEWLATQLAPAGRADSPRAMPLMLRLMEGAHSVSPELPTFALRQLLAAVITGEGPLSAGRAHFSRVVDGRDVGLLRRILGAGGGGEGRPVSRSEAEALFDIHRACVGGTNDPDFEPLFLRSIQQHLRAASGLNAGSRGSVFAPVAQSGNGAHFALDLLAMAGYQPDRSGHVEPVRLSEEPARWLAGRILSSGDTAAARALAPLLIGTDASDSASLRALVDRAA